MRLGRRRRPRATAVHGGRARRGAARSGTRSSAASIAVSGSPRRGTPFACEPGASRSGVWPPNETTTPSGCSSAHTSSARSRRERLEIEAIGRVVVGGHRFRVRVHEHGFVAELAVGLRRVHAAVVELDPWPMRFGPEPRTTIGIPSRGGWGVGRLVREIEVRRLGLELSRAGVDGKPCRADPRSARVPTSTPWRAASAGGSVSACAIARSFVHEVGMNAGQGPGPAEPLRAGGPTARAPVAAPGEIRSCRRRSRARRRPS